MGIVKSSFKSFFWNILGSGLGFIFQIVSAKVLGATVFGEANYYLGYSATISIFLCFGLQTYLSKKLPVSEDREKIFSDVFWIYTLLYFLFSLFISVAFVIRELGFVQIIAIILLGYFTILSDIIFSYYIGIGQTFKGTFTRRFLYNAYNLIIFLLGIIFLQKKYYLYLLAMLISYAIICIFFVFKHIHKIEINFNIIKDSKGFYFIQLLGGVYMSYSKVLQKHFATYESVAVLSISLTIGGLVAILGDNFAKVSMSEFVKAWREKDLVRLRNTYMTVSRINCYLVLPIAFMLILNSSRVLKILGKSYNGGEIIFILVMISQLINSFTGPNGTLLIMTKYANYEVINGIFKLVSAVLISLILGKRYIWAIAAALALSELVVNIFKIIEVKNKFNILPYTFINFMYIIAIGILEYISIFLVSKMSNIFIWIFGNFVILLLFYIVTFVFSPNKNDKVIIEKSIQKLIK